MRIFVTGATGFIGGHFAERALAAGHQVVGLYRAERPERSALVSHLLYLGADLRQGDIRDPQSLSSALQGVDCVAHFAGAFREADATEEFFDAVNVEGTRNVLNAAAEKNVRRFVFCSTAGIYGKNVSGVADENSPVLPWNAYERSKLNGERELRERANKLGMEYVILRPGVVYGPRDERLHKLFSSVAKGRFPMFGKGNGRRPMVYVTDVADAFIKACEVPQAANQEFIITGDRAVTLREMLETLASVSGQRRCGPHLPLKPMQLLAAVVEDVCRVLRVKPPLYRRRMDFYVSDAAFDCRRAQASLQWRPEVDLRDGLTRTLKSYDLGPSATKSQKVGVAQRTMNSIVVVGHLLMVQTPGLF